MYYPRQKALKAGSYALFWNCIRPGPALRAFFYGQQNRNKISMLL